MRLGRLFLLALVLVVTVSACDTEAYQITNSFVKKWTGATIRQTLRYTLGISTGSSVIDDIVDGHKAADELAAADKIWQQATLSSLPGGLDAAGALLDNAISLRPDDWRYRISRAAVAIEQGDVREFDYQLAQTNPDAQASADDQAQEQNSIREQKIATLTQVEAVMTGQFTSAVPCTEFYGELRNLYQHRFDDSTHSQRDLDQVVKYDGLVKGCASLPQ